MRQALEPDQTYRLVFMSVSQLPPLNSGGEQVVVEIINAGQQRNRARGVTGALSFNELHFVQVLEGAKEDVEQIFDRISRDNRHRNVQVLAREWIARRDFTDWAMAYVGARDEFRLISPNPELADILAQPRRRVAALIEMMKFFLYNGRAGV